MWKRVATVGATTGALVVAALVSAVPASASSEHYASNPEGLGFAGYGSFDSSYDGDREIFYACDLEPDGYGVTVDWRVVANPSNSGSVHDGDTANGNCFGQPASIGEGRAVEYRICFTRNGNKVDCTGWFRDYA